MRLIELTFLFSDTSKGYEFPDKRIFMNPRHIMRILPLYNSHRVEHATVVLENGDRYDVFETCDQINNLIDKEVQRASAWPQYIAGVGP